MPEQMLIITIMKKLQNKKKDSKKKYKQQIKSLHLRNIANDLYAQDSEHDVWQLHK